MHDEEMDEMHEDDDQTLPDVPVEALRLPDESAENFACFLVYLRLGTGRGIGKVAARLRRNRRYLERLSARHDWVRRARAFDAVIERRALRDLAQEALAARRAVLGMQGDGGEEAA